MFIGRYASLAGLVVLLSFAQVGLPPAATAQRCEALSGHGSNEAAGKIVLNDSCQVDTDTRRSAPATVVCNGHGLVVRGVSLVLENLVFQNCSRSITLLGPKASLTAINVTFEGSSVKALGSVIGAQDANVTLRSVLIRNNLATAPFGPSLDASSSNGSSHHVDPKPLYYTDCNGSSDTALHSHSSSGSNGTCGSPVLQTSIIHLNSSSAVISNSYITDNTADAIIAAEGSSTETLYISDETVISHNAATWLLVADSWRHDPVGRLVITTPQPSPTTPKLNFTPPYVTKDLMSGLRSDDVHDPALTTADKALPEKYVGNASEGQTPLRLIIQDSSLTHNTASEGLMWLRLVSTSLSNTNITHNQAGGRRQATQGATVSAAAGKHAAAAAAVKPPGPCEIVNALHGALIQVKGPAAFDINRCIIDSNVQQLGAVIRVTQGAALTSIRSSMFRNNTATALLRVEGRSWVTDWGNFSEAVEYLDVIWYAPNKGYTPDMYEAEVKLRQDFQDQKDRSVQYATWYMANCTLVDNKVFHSLIITIGNRTQYQEYRAQQVTSSFKAVGYAAALDDASVAWWMVGCTVERNQLLVPTIVSTRRQHGKSASLAAIQGFDAGYKDCEQPSTAALQQRHIVPPQEGLGTGQHSAAAGSGGYSGDWLLALPDDTTYAAAIADILSADNKTLGNLSQSTGTGRDCSCTLRSMLLSDHTKAARQPQAFPRAPAVLWNSFSTGYLADTTFLRNEGFSHILRMDNSMATLQQVNLTANNVSASVFNAWYGDFWWHQGVMDNNSVWDVGSVLATESILGHFKLIDITSNTAGPAAAQDDSPTRCTASTPPHTKKFLGGSTMSGNRTAGCNTSNSSSTATDTSSSTCLSSVWRLSNLENATLQGLVFMSNNGSIALDVATFYTANGAIPSVSGILIQHNRASGVRMLSTIPKYEGQPVVVDNVTVKDNIQGSALVGGLVLGDFSSDVGTSMPVTVSNCNLSNNTVAIGSNDTQTLGNLQLQGGGLRFTAPNDDDSTNGQHGYLTSVSITVSNTVIAGNVAAEGGGVWSAWPFVMNNCSITGNMAVQSGGGMYLRGMQKDALAMNAVSVANTSITGNCARFGGGVACENCRAVLAANISTNSAVKDYNCSRNGPAAVAALLGSIGGSSSSCDVGTQNKFLADTVEGAGGGIAANMGSGTSSFVLVCGYSSREDNSSSRSGGSGTSSRGSSSTAAGLLGNRAETVGGAVYLNATVPDSCIPVFTPGNISHMACWDCLQAVQQSNSNSNSSSSSTPVLVASGHSGPLAVPLPCGITLYDVVWNHSTAAAGGDLVALAQQPQQQPCAVSPLGTNTSASGADFPGFQVFSCNDSEQTRSGDTAPRACQRNCPVSRPWMQSNNGPLTVFNFPYKLYVYNTDCLGQQPQNATVCQVSVQPPASSIQQGQQAIPQVYAGHTMDFTVSYAPITSTPSNQSTHLKCQIHDNNMPDPVAVVPGYTVADADLGRIVLQQSDEGLMVVGNQNAMMKTTGLARFPHMSLQPTGDPLGNKDYTFSFGPQDGDALLRQVQAIDVTVTLLRCTLGQQMTVQRCVNCSDNGTYSLHYSVPCYPCPVGGTCDHGLLTPGQFYYQPDPLVPQVISCPIKIGCNGTASHPDMQLLLQRLGLIRQRPAAVTTSTPGRNLRQAAAATADSSGGITGSDTQNAEGALLPRAQAFLEFQRSLARTLTLDTQAGQALLLGVNYTALLEDWHKLQCTPGYTGNLCAQCDPNYTSISGNTMITTRYGFYLNKCISCEDGSASWPAVVALYFIWCGYLAFGILMQLKAPRLCAVASPTPLMSGTALDNSRAMAALQDSKSVEAGAAAPAATETLYPMENEARYAPQLPQLERLVGQEQQEVDLYSGSDWPAAGEAAIQQSANQQQQQFAGASHGGSHQQRYQYLEQEPDFDESPFQPRLQQDRFEAETQQSVSAAGGAPASGLAPSASVSAATGGVRAMLVAIWKILTSYVQVVAMVRYLRLPLIPQLTLILTGPDISSFTSFLSMDCLLPGPAWTHPYIRIMLTAVGLPILLFITAWLAWIAAWGVQQLAVRMQARRGQSAGLPPAGGAPPVPDLEPGEVAVELAVHASASMGPEPTVQDPLGGPAGPGRSPSSWQRLQQQLVGVSQFVGSELHKVPAWTAAGLQRLGVRTAPGPLKEYLSLRLLVTVVVLCYSCYPLVTSSMLQALACESIGSCSHDADDPCKDSGEIDPPDLLKYGSLHCNWTRQRNNTLQGLGTNSTGSNISGNSSTQLTGPDPYMPNKFRLEATAPISDGLTCGVFWREDYSVRCHTGRHIWMTVFGAVGLFLLGVLLPLMVGVMLWKNRHRLREWDFVQRYSFLYSEYRRQYCYWEVVIIARKLLFLAATTLLPMTKAWASTDVAYLQLQVGVMLAIMFLVCQEILRPFNSALLNHLERVGLSATALSYSLIVCAMVLNSEQGQLALLGLLAALNLCVIGFFLFKIGRLLWDLFRAPAAGWLRVARQQGGTWCWRRATLVQRQVTSCCRS